MRRLHELSFLFLITVFTLAGCGDPGTDATPIAHNDKPATTADKPTATTATTAQAEPATAAGSAAAAAGHAPAGYTVGSYDDWCGGHAVPESQCTRCNPSLIPAFKVTGDWCAEHQVPESQCLKCDPDLEIVRPPKPDATAQPAPAAAGDE